ncbi:MAG: glycosyltransferase [Prosthecobacter sp.]|uniref:glycosyltransferase family 2 protein n=1 Tax=Prosthecobacter sp. TaxID=1965333 RepID=UPI003BB07BC6
MDAKPNALEAMIIPISVAVPACRRSDQLRATLIRLQACTPPPAEILVHLDGNDNGLRALVTREFPQVRLLHSSALVGPGGARNRLMQEALCPWVAHFDDDSFPQDTDYFAKAWKLISELPETAVFCASILPLESPDPQGLWRQAFYPGCGHLMNRDWFRRTRGYLPVPIAYNLEEVDVSLQLHELGGLCLQSGELRVFHDHLPPEREDEITQVAMMINTVIFPLLRYPVAMWPQAGGSILRRLLQLSLRGEWRVIRRSLRTLPAAIVQYLPLRAPVSFAGVLSWLLLRRLPLRVAVVSSPASS